MRMVIKREYVVFNKGLDEQERKEKWERNGGKVEQRIRPSEGVLMMVRRDRAVRLREHIVKSKRAILVSIREDDGKTVIIGNVYVESGDEERRAELWKEVIQEIKRVEKGSNKCEIIIGGDWNACVEHNSVFVTPGQSRKIDVEMRQCLVEIGVEDKVSQ